MANHANSGTQSANASYPVANFVSYTVYAAAGSVVTATAGSKTTTYTLPAANMMTITDLADSIAVNATYVVVGLVSQSQD